MLWATAPPLVLPLPPLLFWYPWQLFFSNAVSPRLLVFRLYAWLNSNPFRKSNKAWCWCPPYGWPACHQTFATRLKDVYAVLYQRDSSSSAAPCPLVSVSPRGRAAGVREPGPRSKITHTLAAVNTLVRALRTLNLSAPQLLWDPEQRAPVSPLLSHPSHFGSGASRAPRGQSPPLLCSRRGVL